LEHEFVHDAQDLLVRLDDARSVEVLADFAEHIAPLRIERARGEGIRIVLGVLAGDSQFLRGPHAKEFVAVDCLLPVVAHSIFPVPPVNTPILGAPSLIWSN
jgi:hypothetical protein